MHAPASPIAVEVNATLDDLPVQLACTRIRDSSIRTTWWVSVHWRDNRFVTQPHRLDSHLRNLRAKFHIIS